MAYTTESFTIDGVNFKDIQCYGKNNPTANGETSMIRQWIKQKYPKYSGVDAVSVSNLKYAGGHTLYVNFNRLPEEDFDKIREELLGFFQAGITNSGYHYIRTSKNYTATNGENYRIGILYINVKNYPKFGSSASKNPAPDWSSMTTPTTSTTKGGFKRYPTRQEFGDLIRQCAGWDIYQKDGTTYLKKQKDTEPNKDKWTEILGALNTQEGFFWRRNLQAFERNVILSEALLDSVCNLLSKYYTSKSEPTAQSEPTPTTTQPTSTFPPKYFIVQQEEGSNDWEQYIDWLNKTYDASFKGNNYNYWYGIDNDEGMVNAWENKSYFKNNPQVFTANDFMDKLKDSGNYNPNKTTTSDKELFENQINKLKKLALISSKEDAQLFNNKIEKLNKLLKLLN